MDHFQLKDDFQTTERAGIPSNKHITTYQQLFQQYKFDQLTPTSFYAYGMGHFLNDLTASYWFNFSLYFLITVAKTQAAAFTFLVGQIVDSICTPLVGYFSDKFDSKYGKRTPWYCVGYFIVIACFPFIFKVVHYGTAWEMVYYGTFAGLFNVGWAFCQISHMSLVPSISCSKTRKQKLNNLRNTATFIANFVLLGLVSYFLSLHTDSARHESYFFDIAVIVIIVGSIPTLFFLFNIREKMLTDRCQQHRRELLQLVQKDDTPIISHIDFKWYFWLKKASFYFVGFAYVTARLSVNVMITLLPFYVKRLSHSSQHDITIALLLLYMSSILTSTYTKRIMEWVGRRWVLTLGFLLSIAASMILCSAFNTVFETQLIFLATSVIGIAQAIIINSVLNFICEVIGDNGLKGGFVFGSYSFMDKISTGLVVYIISNGAHLNNSTFLRYLVLLLPPLLSLLSCLMVCLALPKQSREDEQAVAPTSLLEKELM